MLWASKRGVFILAIKVGDRMKKEVVEKHIADLEYSNLDTLSLENRINRLSRILRDVLKNGLKKKKK